MKGLTAVAASARSMGVFISATKGGTYPAVSMLSLERGLRRWRRQSTRRVASAARTAKPPMIPPTIAPVGVDF